MNFHGCISFILSQNAYYLKIINIWTNTLRRINRYIKKRNIESKLVSPHQFYVHALNMEVYIKRLQKPYLKVTERKHGLIYFFPESSICIVTRVTMKFWVKKLSKFYKFYREDFVPYRETRKFKSKPWLSRQRC